MTAALGGVWMRVVLIVVRVRVFVGVRMGMIVMARRKPEIALGIVIVSEPAESVCVTEGAVGVLDGRAGNAVQRPGEQDG